MILMKKIKIKLILRKFFRLKDITLILLLFLAVGFFLLFPHIAYAITWDAAAKEVARICSYIIYGLIILPFSYLLTALIYILIQVVQINEFINAPAVAVGWSIVRDLCNMFFVLGLLVVAFGTILRVENYHYKKILPKLLLVAVLVNFSRTICGIIIDFSQVIMLTFVNGFKDIAAGNLINRLGLDVLLKNGEVSSYGGLNLNASTVLGAFVLVAVMVIVYVAVIFSLIIFLVVRIVMLWLLIVLSPLAFLAGALPFSQRYSTQWWHQFGKYVVTGPALAFFLWLSFYIMSGPELDPGSGIIPSNSGTAVKAGVAKALESNNLMSYIIAIVLLIGSLIMAGKSGVVGASVASKSLGALKRSGLGLFKTAYGYAGRKLNETLPGYLNPVALVRGFKARSKELEEKAKTIASARGRNVAERILTFGRVNIPYEQQVEESFEAQYARDFAGLSKEQKAYQARKLSKMGGAEGRRRRRALIRVAAEGGHIDDIMSSNFFRKEFKWVDSEGEKKKGFNDESVDGEKNEWYTQGKIHAFLKSYMGTDQQSLRVMSDLEEIGKKVTHQEYGGHVSFNDEKGKWQLNEGNGLVNKSIGEASKISARELTKQSPHNFVNLKERDVWVYNDQEGEVEKIRTVAGAGTMGKFNTQLAKRAWSGQDATEIKRYSQARNAYMLMGGTPSQSNIDPDGYAHINSNEDLKRLEQIFEINPKALKALYERAGGKEGEFKLAIHKSDGSIKAKIENMDQFKQFISEGGESSAQEAKPAESKEGKPAKGSAVPKISQATKDTFNTKLDKRSKNIINAVSKAKFPDSTAINFRRFHALKKALASIQKVLGKLDKADQAKFGRLKDKINNLNNVFKGVGKGASKEDIAKILKSEGLTAKDVHSIIEQFSTIKNKKIK